MGKWVHRLTNKDLEAEVADCEKCGPGVPIYVPRSGVPSCKVACRERRAKYKANARARGTHSKGAISVNRGTGTRTFRNRDGSAFSLSE